MQEEMKLDEIQELWAQDSKIDPTQLDTEALKIPQLHSKYLKLRSTEKMKLKALEAEYAVLKAEKYEFLTQGPSKETVKKYDWNLPAKGRSQNREERDTYLEADPDLIKLGLKIAVQAEKVDVLDSIIGAVNSRSYTIHNAIEYLKWTKGSD